MWSMHKSVLVHTLACKASAGQPVTSIILCHVALRQVSLKAKLTALARLEAFQDLPVSAHSTGVIHMSDSTLPISAGHLKSGSHACRGSIFIR